MSEKKPNKIFEDKKALNHSSNKELNKKRFVKNCRNENNIILYKKDVFEIDSSLSNGENFVMNKLPLFSFMPFSELDEFDFEYNDCLMNKTIPALNNMDNNESSQSIKGNSIL